MYQTSPVHSGYPTNLTTGTSFLAEKKDIADSPRIEAEPSISVELEKLDKTISLLFQAIEQVVLKAKPYLKGDPVHYANASMPENDGLSSSSDVQRRLHTANDCLYKQFVILQNFGSYLDT